MSLEDQIRKALAALPTKPRTYIVRPAKPKGGKRRAFGPRGGVTEVQSLLFPRKTWNEDGARIWAGTHGFRDADVDVAGKHIRLRQAAPGHFKRMRTKILSRKPLVKAIIGVRR